jgi:hypothetical protein
VTAYKKFKIGSQEKFLKAASSNEIKKIGKKDLSMSKKKFWSLQHVYVMILFMAAIAIQALYPVSASG